MSPLPKQPRLQEELEILQDRLLAMAGMAEDLVRQGVEAFLEKDPGALAAMREADAVVDELEMEVDRRSVELVALHQPVATDLRRVFVALRVANDLERIGDHALNIAKAARRLAGQGPLPEFPEMAELALLARRMLRDALGALGTRDAAKAREVCARDDRVDEMRRAVYAILTARMQADPSAIAASMEFLRVSQQLERIGDLSTNIAEEVVFLVEGKSIKHRVEQGGKGGKRAGKGGGPAEGADGAVPGTGR